MSADDGVVVTSYGFNWRSPGSTWLRCFRMASHRGYRIVRIGGEDPDGPSVDAYVSPKGRSIRVFRGTRELT